MPDPRLKPLLTPLPRHLIVRHTRRTSFRWMGLVELSIVVGLFIVAAPLIATGLLAAPVAAVIGLGVGAGKVALVGSTVLGLIGAVRSTELVRLAVFSRYHHDVELIAVRGEGRSHRIPLTAAMHTPDEFEALIAGLLAEADDQGLVVVEKIGTEPAECVEVWYGGQPLMAPPGLPALDDMAATLSSDGATVTRGDSAISITRSHPTSGRSVGVMVLLVLLLISPLLLVQRRPVRRPLRQAWGDLRGQAHTTALTVTAEGITWREARGERALEEITVPTGDLLGIAWGPALGWDAQVTRHHSTLRIIGREQTIHAPQLMTGPRGATLRSFLSGAVLTLRPAEAQALTCPWCGAHYALADTPECPACGAWAEGLAG